ncbi:MAG: hypothetical protein ACFB8W_00180 [Elainellaceae cyanobacterium]
MAKYDDASNRAWLEALYHLSPSVSVPHQFWSFFKMVGLSLKEVFTRSRQQLRISKYYDINGRAIWHVYDPVTQTSFSSKSERDVHAWIEAL